ncbi:MAG: glycosyltransferase family 2 protein [Acidobacteriota bacterium]|nr:glycosyltransferase family 2 protein [Acidobacteriota bacterium]
MSNNPDVTIVISTYNRAAELRPALDSVLAQQTGGVCYEVIVVDNNSTDDTRQVVESLIATAPVPLRYVFEGRPGIPHGRNAGIEAARASIIAFTDDDNRVAPDWVQQIKRALDAHPEVDYVGGRVLPEWSDEPPSWLTPAHWSPLALTDYGDASFYSNASNPVCLITANLALRRSLFDRIGFFAPRMLRCSDHELQLRAWRAGRQGMYVPQIVVIADVQPERLTEAYHRRWHRNHGKYSALMQYSEHLGIEIAAAHEESPTSAAPNALRLYGIPAFVCRRSLAKMAGWSKQYLSAALRGERDASFYHANRLRHLVNYLATAYKQDASRRPNSHITEITSFTRSLIRKKIRATDRTRPTARTPQPKLGAQF